MEDPPDACFYRKTKDLLLRHDDTIIVLISYLSWEMIENVARDAWSGRHSDAVVITVVSQQVGLNLIGTRLCGICTFSLCLHFLWVFWPM